MLKFIQFFLIFTLLNIPKSYSQITSTRGSFMIAAICKDGIIIGSDSRLTLLNNNKPYAYIDSIQKIFPGKNYLIGLMGTANVDNYNISYLTRKFTDSLPIIPNELSFIFYHWDQYIERMLPSAKLDLDGMAIFLAGYRNSKPNIYFNYRNGNFVTSKRTGFVEQDTTTFGAKYSEKMSCKKAKKWITLAINKYATDKNRTQFIGGPIYFIKITKDNSVNWFNEKPPKEYQTLDDISRDTKKIIKYNPT